MLLQTSLDRGCAALQASSGAAATRFSPNSPLRLASSPGSILSGESPSSAGRRSVRRGSHAVGRRESFRHPSTGHSSAHARRRFSASAVCSCQHRFDHTKRPHDGARRPWSSTQRCRVVASRILRVTDELLFCSDGSRVRGLDVRMAAAHALRDAGGSLPHRCGQLPGLRYAVQPSADMSGKEVICLPACVHVFASGEATATRRLSSHSGTVRRRDIGGGACRGAAGRLPATSRGRGSVVPLPLRATVSQTLVEPAHAAVDSLSARRSLSSSPRRIETLNTVRQPFAARSSPLGYPTVSPSCRLLHP